MRGPKQGQINKIYKNNDSTHENEVIKVTVKHFTIRSVELLLATLKPLTNLKELVFRNNKVSKQKIILIFKYVSTSLTITSFTYANSGLNAAHGLEIFNLLKSNKILTSINLNDNQLFGKAAKFTKDDLIQNRVAGYIKDGLKENKILTSLSLNSCFNHVQSINEIFKAFDQNVTLVDFAIALHPSKFTGNSGLLPIPLPDSARSLLNFSCLAYPRDTTEPSQNIATINRKNLEKLCSQILEAKDPSELGLTLKKTHILRNQLSYLISCSIASNCQANHKFYLQVDKKLTSFIAYYPLYYYAIISSYSSKAVDKCILPREIICRIFSFLDLNIAGGINYKYKVDLKSADTFASQIPRGGDNGGITQQKS